MIKRLSQLVSLFSLFLFTIRPDLALAVQGFGAIAGDIAQPVNVLADFIYSACFVLGSSFVFASVIKYFEHRRSPLMVPVSTPVCLFLEGAALICVPFISYLSSDVPQYSFFR
jgi:hypothetical protein